MANSLYACPLPRLPAIRRVPVCYHHILPLPLVKHLQCVVVGAARGVLTVAIANTQHVETIAPLEKITGQRIFAVLVDEAHLRLLIARLERNARQTHRWRVGRPHYLHRLQIQSYIDFLTNEAYPCG